MKPQPQKPKQQQIQQPLSDRHHQNRQQGTSSRRHNFKKNHHHHHHGHRKNPLSTAVSDSPSSLSVNRLKTKIRDLTRLLRRPDHLPADVLVVQERALAGYKQALEGIEREKRKKEMIGKYHMVRFFGLWALISFLFFSFFWFWGFD
jgi:G3E family GTPase